MGYDIYLKKGEEKRVLAGHPWVYANEVARIEGKDKNGALATVLTHDGKFVGKGYINHLSKILVRIFIRDEDEEDCEALYLSRLHAANKHREALGMEGCYRMVFAESDLLPALIVDRYGDYLVTQFLSLGIDKRKQLIVDCLVKLFAPKGIYERSDVSVRAKEGLDEVKGTLYGDVPDKIYVTENGIKLAIDVKNGQKTGYFLDQKENRLAVRRYCRGARVLDCFSNSGGFSLNAATVASEVTALDISQLALDNVLENAALNGFDNITALKGDVFDVLREMKAKGERYDAVILDPPAFCKNAAEVKDAYRGYLDINSLGMKLVNSGGYLITCSCSHYMTATLFEKMLAEAAAHIGRPVRMVEARTQAPDHPALLSADETRYLKFYVLQIGVPAV